MASTSKAPNSRKALVFAGAIFGLACVTSAVAQGNYYRYLNDEGIRVMSHSIPPQYAQKGYEILTHTGQVIKTVPPAPDPDELEAEKAKRTAEREMLAAYAVLARRYSSVEEIYAARDRRLAHLDATIAILRSNIGNLSGQVEDLVSKAAEAERSGREVPQQILKNIDEVKAEQTTTESKLQARIEEHAGIHAEYEADVELFNKGRALEAARKTQSRQ